MFYVSQRGNDRAALILGDSQNWSEKGVSL
jgi:hypothetical protein